MGSLPGISAMFIFVLGWCVAHIHFTMRQWESCLHMCRIVSGKVTPFQFLLGCNGAVSPTAVAYVHTSFGGLVCAGFVPQFGRCVLRGQRTAGSGAV